MTTLTITSYEPMTKAFSHVCDIAACHMTALTPNDGRRKNVFVYVCVRRRVVVEQIKEESTRLEERNIPYTVVVHFDSMPLYRVLILVQLCCAVNSIEIKHLL